MSFISHAESLLDPEKADLRERALTRWMSRDLKQATVDFCKNVGLVPVYAETREDGKTRYLLWHRPQGMASQTRSGYPASNFEVLQAKAEELGWPLLTLQISRGKEDLYSGVWVSSDLYDHAVEFLALYGIFPAAKTESS